MVLLYHPSPVAGEGEHRGRRLSPFQRNVIQKVSESVGAKIQGPTHSLNKHTSHIPQTGVCFWRAGGGGGNEDDGESIRPWNILQVCSGLCNHV